MVCPYRRRLKTMKSASLPQFEAPPVNEVAFGVKYAPVEDMRLAHFGLYWSQLKSEFNRSDTAVPIAPIVPTQEALDLATGLPMPRTWLIHNNEEYLIQLQLDMFFLNWRKMEKTQKYPHYSQIKPQFEKHLDQYFDFLESEGLARPEPLGCELTYVNIIPRGEGWENLSKISAMMPDIGWRRKKGRFLSAPKALNWQALFDLPDDAGELAVKLQSATRTRDQEPALRLELTARGRPGKPPIESITDWYDLAHDWIVLGFEDITTLDVQRKYWKRIDGSA